MSRLALVSEGNIFKISVFWSNTELSSKENCGLNAIKVEVKLFTTSFNIVISDLTIVIKSVIERYSELPMTFTSILMLLSLFDRLTTKLLPAISKN